MVEEKRTYKQILCSFIDELNSKGANIDYEKLTDAQRLELLSVLISECNKYMKPFVVHVLGYNWYWFHDIWFDNFKKFGYNFIVCSRAMGKSVFWTIMLPEYLTFIISKYDVILSSYNEVASFKFLKNTRENIEFNELLSSKLPTAKSADLNKSNIDFGNRSSMKAISITSQIRGEHVNYFVADDILNDEQRLSPEAVKTKIFATIIPTLQRHRGKFTLVGTRFGEDDIFEYAKEKSLMQKDFNYCEIAVELDEVNEKVVFIYKNNKEEIFRKFDEDNIYDYQSLLTLKMVEPLLFAREYECKVNTDRDVPFPVDILLELRDNELIYDDIGSPKVLYKAGLDSSNSTSKDSDETVLIIGYEDKDNNIIPARIFADNRLEAPERLRLIKKELDSFGRPETLTEKNSMGETNIQLINNEGYRLTSFFTDRLSKMDITDAASNLIKRRKIKFPYKRPKDQKITDKLIHQLSGVKLGKTKTGLPSYIGTTKHDDYYIGFVLMIKCLLSGKGRAKAYTFSRYELR